MVKTIVGIDGMMCGMCESHVNDVIRKSFDVKKVSSSHSKKRTEIISEEANLFCNYLRRKEREFYVKD